MQLKESCDDTRFWSRNCLSSIKPTTTTGPKGLTPEQWRAATGEKSVTGKKPWQHIACQSSAPCRGCLVTQRWHGTGWLVLASHSRLPCLQPKRRSLWCPSQLLTSTDVGPVIPTLEQCGVTGQISASMASFPERKARLGIRRSTLSTVGLIDLCLGMHGCAVYPLHGYPGSSWRCCGYIWTLGQACGQRHAPSYCHSREMSLAPERGCEGPLCHGQVASHLDTQSAARVLIYACSHISGASQPPVKDTNQKSILARKILSKASGQREVLCHRCPYGSCSSRLEVKQASQALRR